MGISNFSWEQENLLLEFLEKVESWVQAFVWDLSDKSRLALHKADSHLTKMRWQIERRLKEKRESSIAANLHKRHRVVQRAQVELRAVKPRVELNCLGMKRQAFFYCTGCVLVNLIRTDESLFALPDLVAELSFA